MGFVLNTSNVYNGFDDFGHYLRTQLQITNCVEFVPAIPPDAPSSGCEANWAGSPSPAAFSGPAPAPSEETLRGDGGTIVDLLAGEDEDTTDRTRPRGDGGTLDLDAPDEAQARQDATGDLLQFLVGGDG